MALVPSSFLLLVVRPGAPSSVVAPSSDGLQPNSDSSLVLGKIIDLSLSVFKDA